jgi:hypothetical protein
MSNCKTIIIKCFHFYFPRYSFIIFAFDPIISLYNLSANRLHYFANCLLPTAFRLALLNVLSALVVHTANCLCSLSTDFPVNTLQ